MSFKLKILRATVDYFRNSNISCFKYFVSTDRPLIERIIWFIATVCWISLTVWLVAVSYTYVERAPTVTSEMPMSMAIVDIPFPAVAVCSENRISRRKLLEYSMFILNAMGNRSHIGDTVSKIADSLLLLGKMYNLDASDADFYRMDRVHTMLLQAYDGAYPFPEILANLTPECNELLERCKWAGEQVDCNSIFHSRRTYSGMCCIFNYLRPSPDLLRKQFLFNATITVGEPVRVTKHGPDFGLMVLVNQKTDDYAFAMNSNIGCRILIFDTSNFPDNISGAVKEKFLSIGEEMFLSINALPSVGSDGLRRYSKELRNCVFNDEISLIYENFYSLSECLLTCRLVDISRFCGCVPPQFLNIIPNQNMCLLNDMPCLNRWKLKWFNLEPEVRHFMTLDLHCPSCLPMCNFIKYNIESSTSNFASNVFASTHVDHNFTKGIHDANYSIINVNFASESAKVHDQSPLFAWYELLAAFGGMACLTLGASLINIAEIFYFASGKFGGQTDRASPHTQDDTITLLNYPDDFQKQPVLPNKYYRRMRLTDHH